MTDRVLSVFRKGGVAAIALLSGETLRVPSPLFLERRLREGDYLDPAEYREFIRRRAPEHALAAAAKYLETRERSAGEVAAHLKSKAYDDSVIAQTLETLKSRRFVSDARFASLWADARSRKYGRARIAAELSRKGVSRADADAALAALDPDIALAQAAALAEKLLSRRANGDTARHSPDPDVSRRALNALLRRGYSYAIAREALRLAGEDGEEYDAE